MDLRVISYKKIPDIEKFIFKLFLSSKLNYFQIKTPGAGRGRGHSVNKAKVYLMHSQKNISILLLNLQKCLVIIIIIIKALCSLNNELQTHTQIKDHLQQTHLVCLFWALDFLNRSCKAEDQVSAFLTNFHSHFPAPYVLESPR